MNEARYLELGHLGKLRDEELNCIFGTLILMYFL